MFDMSRDEALGYITAYEMWQDAYNEWERSGKDWDRVTRLFQLLMEPAHRIILRQIYYDAMKKRQERQASTV